MTETKRFNIEEVPLVNLFIATDKFRRIRFSADIITMFKLREVAGYSAPRMAFGYDYAAKAITIRPSASHHDPTAANVDMRGYASVSRFYRKTKLPEVAQRYTFAAEQDGWLIFTAE